MNFLEGMRAAFETLRAHRLRAFFIVQCTAVGVGFLIAMITFINGMGKYVEREFVGKLYGFNTVQLTQVPAGRPAASAEEARMWSRRPPLTFEDAAWLERHLETSGTTAFSASGTTRVGAIGGKGFDRVRVIGASSSHFSVQGLAVRRGRPFTAREAERGTAVAVLGWDVAQKLFGAHGRDPLGRQISVNRRPYRVVGVLDRRGKLLGFSMDRFVIVPAQSAANGSVYRQNQAHTIAFKVRDGHALAAAASEIEGLLRVRHRLGPSQPDDFAVGTSEALLAAWGRISRVLLIAAPCLIGIALVVGIMVTMNIMLVVVTERTPEVGLRKALGARNRDILFQFLVEAGALSGLGGALGVGFGIVLATAVAAVSPLPLAVAPWSVAAGILMGILVGLSAGVYPAYRAAQLDPIVAMGRE